jgi:hypothetical protein
VLEKLIKNIDKPVKGLEIGVWFGEGSTRIWLENCQENSEFWLVDSWKPYASKQDLEKSQDWRDMDSAVTDAYVNTLSVVNEYCNKRPSLNINILRGDSESCLKSFADGSFSLIYVDGDHKYKKVKSDIIEAKRLINKDFGILIGDDLEASLTERNYDISKQTSDLDFDENLGGHPGVLAAVMEEFNSVNVENCIWYVVYLNGQQIEGSIKIR